jgi:hypothetical protein
MSLSSRFNLSLLDDICLINILTKAIFMGSGREPVIFDWSEIGRHSSEFSDTYNMEDAKVLLQLSFMVTNANFAGKRLGAPEWLHDTPIKYSICPLKIISMGIPDSYINNQTTLGHILYNERGNIIFIVFTGTVNECMAGMDMNYTQTEYNGVMNYESGVKGHRGIYDGYQSIRSELIQVITSLLPRNPKIIITGHSLGGALSNICALDLAYYNPLHYSFASPLVFNAKGSEVFNRLVKNSYRIANISDLIVLSPLPVMPNGDAFCHVGTPILFQRNTGKYSDNHEIAYILEYGIPYTRST